MFNLTGMSKFLAYVLRHRPDVIGIEIDNEGWVDIEQLISCMRAYQEEHRYDKITHSLLDEIVDNDNKGRYEISECGWKIRACQGHSIPIKIQFDERQPPATLYHGTAERNVESILREGLNKRNRTHVHLSTTHDQAFSVGRRHGKPIVLRIKSGLMFDDGCKFYLSSNKVWLVEHVPSQYIECESESNFFENE